MQRVNTGNSPLTQSDSEEALRQHLIAISRTNNCVPELIAHLDHPSDTIRATAAALLGDTPESVETVRALTECLLDQHHAVREMAAQSISRMAQASISVLPTLLRCLLRNSREVRLHILNTMQQLGPAASPVLQHLLRLTDETPAPITAAIIHTIAAMKDHATPALPKLRALLNHPHDIVRAAATQAIAQIENSHSR